MIQRIRFGTEYAVGQDRQHTGFEPELQPVGEVDTYLLHFNSYMSGVPIHSKFPGLMRDVGVIWSPREGVQISDMPDEILVLNPFEVVGNMDRVVAMGRGLVQIGEIVGPGNEIIEFRDLSGTMTPGRHALHG